MGFQERTKKNQFELGKIKWENSRFRKKAKSGTVRDRAIIGNVRFFLLLIDVQIVTLNSNENLANQKPDVP